MLTSSPRLAGALLLSVGVACTGACGSFGTATDTPGTDAGTNAPPGADAAAPSGEGGSVSDEVCVPFSARLDQPDLASAGFADPTVVQPASLVLGNGASGPPSRALLAQVTADMTGASAAYASLDLDLAQDRAFSSVSVSFDLQGGPSTAGSSAIIGCMLYARASRATGYPNNQLSFERAGLDAPNLNIQTRAAPETTTTSKDTAFPLATTDWAPVTLKLSRVSGEVRGEGMLGDPPNLVTTPSVSLASVDPRWITVKCGIPYADTSDGSKTVVAVAVANIRGQLCTNPR